MNVMRELRISKVTVNIGVGEGGEKLAKAENLLEKLTEQKPLKTLARSTNPTFGIRKGVPIACKVTLRKEKAEKFLRKALDAVERKLKSTNFDNLGNVSFGIKEHIDIPGVRYDPAVGIFGMDVCLTVERPGYRIKRRKVLQKKISKSHSIAKEEAINFMKEKYNVSVEND
ncbi:MAG: 50S ribosomal protein L5 [Euryarchaeota archaeon]|nr:50S ribosomal protein L5 [Euryarchaeota archaeon]